MSRRRIPSRGTACPSQGNRSVGALAAMVAAVAVGALVSAAPQHVAAQELEPSAEIDALRGVLEQLAPTLERLEPLAAHEAAERARQRAEAAAVSTDTFRVGPLRIVALDGQRPAIETAVASALAPYAPLVTGAEPVVGGLIWGVRLLDGRAGELGIWGPEVRLALAPADPGATFLIRRLGDLIGEELLAALPAALRTWAGSAPLDPGIERTGFILEQLYRLGVMSGSPAFALCIQGDARDCWDLLSGERPALPKVARNSLLMHGLAMGGPGSYARLLASEEAEVPALLAVAAGTDVDTVVRSWAASIADARPVAHQDLASAGALALLWTLTFAGLGTSGMRRTAS